MSILSQAQKLQLQAVLQLRRAALDSQRSAHLEGQSRAEHARELLLQDSDDAEQRDAERELDFALTDRDAVELREIDQALARLATTVCAPIAARRSPPSACSSPRKPCAAWPAGRGWSAALLNSPSAPQPTGRRQRGRPLSSTTPAHPNHGRLSRSF